MRKIIHATAGAGALLLVATFWLSTVASELLGTEAAVIWVKTTIPWAVPIMVLFAAAAGGTGLSMAPKVRSGRIGAKRRRMPFIALNGILVLIPCALFLGWRAAVGQLDATFYAVQALELVAGAINITLLFLNMRDGIATARRWPMKKPAKLRPTAR